MSLDTSIRAELTTKGKRATISAVRKVAEPVFRIYETWGLVDSARGGLRDFIRLLESTNTLWEIAKERRPTPTQLKLLIQILGEAHQETLLLATDVKPIAANPSLPISTKRLREDIDVLNRAAQILREPLHAQLSFMAEPELASQLKTQAILRRPLLTQLSSYEPPKRTRGRPMDPRSQIEEDAGWIVSEKLAAKLASEFLGEDLWVSSSSAKKRKRERERSRRKPAPAATRQ